MQYKGKYFGLKGNIQKNLLFWAIWVLPCTAFAQDVKSEKATAHFGAAASVTQNGISLIPTFSLGKPAAIFDLNLRKRRLSFEPQFRFSLEGKPWSFLFWWRYKLLKTNRFSVNLGAHPALAFRTITQEINGIPQEIIASNRYLAGEFSPNYFVRKNISVGMYYLFSRGVGFGAIQNTHFLTVNTHFSNIQLPRKFYLKFMPQLYYLKMDQQDGYYFTANLTLAKRNWPVSLSYLVNKIIETRITASKNLVWNLTLTYAFHKDYIAR